VPAVPEAVVVVEEECLGVLALLACFYNRDPAVGRETWGATHHYGHAGALDDSAE
jgi:hypothetical protein